MKEIYIHIGLPRTGTSFLQRNIFPKLKLTYLHKNMIFSKIKDGKNLISDEHLSGTIFYNNPPDQYKIIDRIKKLYPDAKIIIVLRDKNDWLKSFYKNYLSYSKKKIKKISYNEFCSMYEKKGWLDFEKYIAYLKNSFNEVLVLNYESLNKNHKDFISSICNFIDVPSPDYNYEFINSSYDIKHYKFLKFLRKYTSNNIANMVDSYFDRILNNKE